MPRALVAHAWKVTARGREQRRCCFRVDTGDRVKGVQRPQHTFRALLFLLSGHCTGVVGGARDVHGFELQRGWVALCHTTITRSPPPPLALEQPIFVGFGQIVDGVGDPHDADRRVGVNSRVPPPPPFPPCADSGQEDGRLFTCTLAAPPSLGLSPLPSHSRPHTSAYIALANCCFVRGYLPMCVLLLSWI